MNIINLNVIGTPQPYSFVNICYYYLFYLFIYFIYLFFLNFFYFNYSYITYITATENNLQYSYIYSYIAYVFCFLQIRTLQCNTIFKTILVEERLNKINIYFKRKKKQKQKRLQCIECTTYNL